ncbi:MAG: outer membrane protein [Geminicoccales bacterium]
MIKNVLCCVAFFVLMTNSAIAQSWSRDNHFYIGYVNGIEFFGGGDDFDYEPAYAFAGQVGYAFGQWRAEGELTYEDTTFDNANNSDFDLEIIRFAASLFYDLPPLSAVGGASPYAGGGLGISNVSVAATANNNDFEDDTAAFTFHGEVGINFNVASRLAIVPHYRFEWFDSGGELGTIDNNFYTHALRVAARVSF